MAKKDFIGYLIEPGTDAVPLAAALREAIGVADFNTKADIIIPHLDEIDVVAGIPDAVQNVATNAADVSFAAANMTAIQAAPAAASLAAGWAETPEDTLVPGGGGGFSALHWAAKAEAAIPGIASQAEAEAGSENTKMMTALRTKQAIDAQSDVPIFATRALAAAYAPAVAPAFIIVVFYDGSEHLNSGGRYRNVGASEPTHTGKFSITLADAVTVVWFELAEEEIWTAMLGADPTSVADQSSKVQDAINVIGARGVDVGGWVYVNRGVKFVLNTLTLPRRLNMRYWATDDTTLVNYNQMSTNEWMTLVCNADADGIVNEVHGITAPFHPGFVQELNNHLNIQDPYLGTNQVRVPTKSSPARMSRLMHHSGWGATFDLYQQYGGPSRYSGFGRHTWSRIQLLHGIGTAAYTVAPTGAGIPRDDLTVVRGAVSGAIGYVRSVVAGYTQIFWTHGIFQVGEAVQVVTDLGLVTETIVQTTVATITSITNSQTANTPINAGLASGTWGFGLGAEYLYLPFVFGGAVGVQKHVSFGQNTPYSDATRVQFHIADDLSIAAGSRSGRYMEWDLNVAAGSRRLNLKRSSDAKVMGQVGAVAAYGSFTDGAGTPAFRGGAFGVSSVVRNATVGRYDITFTEARLSATYTVVAAGQSITDTHVKYGALSTTGFSIFVYDNALAGKWASFDISFVVAGGDI